MDTDKAINLNKLTAEQLAVFRDRATERPFSGQLLHNSARGNYNCAACGFRLFGSDAKFESGTGWPSFDQAVPGAVKTIVDHSHGMTRTEAVCANCGGHLGHVFDDGLKQTSGQRFCINSVCLDFKPQPNV